MKRHVGIIAPKRCARAKLFVPLLIATLIALAPHTALAGEQAGHSGELTWGVVGENEIQEATRDLPEPLKTVSMHRLYNAFTGEHFYTADASEKDELVQTGWFYEGVGWQAPPSSDTPVHRLYNPVAGDHHYTTDSAESANLAKAGWVDEGIGWYSDDAKCVPVFRQYNANAWTGAHNFTCDASENDDLVLSGWQAEDIGWYACGTGWDDVTEQLTEAHIRGLVSCIGSGGDVTLGYRTSIDSAKLDAVRRLAASEVPVTFVAVNTQTGKSIARNADARFYGASTIKAPYAASLCKYDAPGIAGRAGELQAMIAWSSNDAFDSLVATYGRFYESAFAEESGFTMEYPYIGSYVDLTPRELVKLWLTTRAYIVGGGPNVELFRSLFPRGYLKEGWMGAGDLGGQLYHLAGIEGDTVYAIMTRYAYPDNRVWELRDAIVDAIGV